MVSKIRTIYESYISAFINSDEKALYALLTEDDEIDELAKKFKSSYGYYESFSRKCRRWNLSCSSILNICRDSQIMLCTS